MGATVSSFFFNFDLVKWKREREWVMGSSGRDPEQEKGSGDTDSEDPQFTRDCEIASIQTLTVESDGKRDRERVSY